MAASVCTMVTLLTMRLVALTMPDVTVWSKPKGASEGNGELSDTWLSVHSQFRDRQVVDVDVDDCHVGQVVSAEDDARHGATVLEPHRHGGGGVDDVSGSQDQPVFVVDHTRSETGRGVDLNHCGTDGGGDRRDGLLDDGAVRGGAGRSRNGGLWRE